MRVKAQEHLRDAVTVNRMELTSDVVLAIADCQFCQFRHSMGASNIPTKPEVMTLPEANCYRHVSWPPA